MTLYLSCFWLIRIKMPKTMSELLKCAAVPIFSRHRIGISAWTNERHGAGISIQIPLNFG
jgi:hypothetical protein